MPKYEVRVTIKSQIDVEVEADDEEKALDKAVDQCDADGFIADVSWVDAEVVGTI